MPLQLGVTTEFAALLAGRAIGIVIGGLPAAGTQCAVELLKAIGLSSGRQAEALVRRHLLPRWGKLKANAITRTDVRAGFST